MLRLAVFILGIAAVSANCQVGQKVQSTGTSNYNDHLQNRCNPWILQKELDILPTTVLPSASDYEVHGLSLKEKVLLLHSHTLQPVPRSTIIANAKKACNDNAACRSVLINNANPPLVYFEDEMCTRASYAGVSGSVCVLIFSRGRRQRLV